MRFDRLLWSVLLLLLAGGLGWDGGFAKPAEDAELYGAADGGSTIPPPRP